MVSGEFGAGLPGETCPPWELTLILRQTGLPHAWAPRMCPVAGQRSAYQACSPQASHPAGRAQTTPRLCYESGSLPPTPPHLPRGKELSPQVSAGKLTSNRGWGLGWQTGPLGMQGPGVDTGPVSGAPRCNQVASSWAALDRGGGPGSWCPQLSGLSTLVPETDSHSMRPSHPLRQVRLEVLGGWGGRARKPDLPSQGGWGRAVVSSASQEGLRPDCTKAQGLDQLRAEVTRFL